MRATVRQVARAALLVAALAIATLSALSTTAASLSQPAPAAFGVAAEDTVPLFRHVSPGELSDLKASGEFRAGAGSLNGKWFAESGEHATQWGAWLNPEGGSVVRATVPRSFADTLRREAGKYDGIGPARYVDPDQLGDFNRLMRWDEWP